MQPKPLSMISRVAKKETTLFFASPIAYLFLATFAAVTLFTFFWGEAFFARNIADVRPLFEWMPILLIFLASTLTMRLWSEERRTGTLEHVLTLPTPLWQFVVGKFVGCLLLLVIALLITLPLPISVALMGELDWGPVIAGYLATLLLGAAYLSIGLFVSSRSDNQIVSLISAVVICGLFYLIGNSAITNFFGTQTGEFLRLLGTGSRFESITRGVLDIRDFYYYLSIVLVFLSLNTFVLEKERWAKTGRTQNHTQWRLVALLLVANALGANLWLSQTNVLRIDATQGNVYSISEATHNYLKRLQEPLLIRGYFSQKTHPLLAPLVPRLRDLIEEYQVAGKGKVRVEFIDPALHPELESEANQKYAIRPQPFQVNDRYQSSIVSSYFNVLIQYGDEYQVLGFRDLIEVKAGGERDLNVQLRNPEHDLTSAIKKVLNSYQSSGNLFATVRDELHFNAYVSPNEDLPEQLVGFKQEIEQVVNDMSQQANGRLIINFVDPNAGDGSVAQQIASDYGFQPMATSLLSNESFYFYLTLQKGEQAVQIPLGELTQEGFKRDFESAIKRFASGFTKTVALLAPKGNPEMARYGLPQGAQFNQLQAFLGEELNVKSAELEDGKVSGDVDILLLMSPKDLTSKQLFAVDQFLMQGGTVLAATSPFSADFMGGKLTLKKHDSGLSDWLKHHGLTIDDKIIMDEQNAAFPVPVSRNVGGFQIQEMRMLDYPYFIDVRRDGLNQDNLITSELPQATIAWASPIVAENKPQRKITPLLSSSEKSWLSNNTNIMPQLNANGESAYTPEGEQKSHTIGVMAEGRFTSYFAGKDSPLLETKSNEEATPLESSPPEMDTNADAEIKDEKPTVISSVIEHSPESARIILFSSNDFLRDQILQMTGSAGGSEYLSTLQMTANAVDWSLQDAGLLSIRARGHFNRTLPPMDVDERAFWEYLNYFLAALALALVAGIQFQRKKAKQLSFAQLLTR